MEWLRVVIEWINSLNVLEAPIKTISAFQDKKLYEKLIKLSWKKDPNTSDGKDILTTFIEDEYPKFRINKGKDQGYSEDIYIVTLLLSHVSLNTVFHQPMCTKLPHEIQVIIKSFLEIVLPYGRSITIEVLKDAIMDLTSSEKDNAFKTPRSHSLKGFFTSPVARSAQSHRMLNEKNRELQHLRSELETERFEKADLQEDLKIEQNKVQGLLKQLEEKSTEIKTLKAEKIKFATPQSCKKKKNTLYNEDYYKKEINKLENQLTQCHDELIKLEDQKTNITKKLKFAEKRNTSLHEKCNNLERSIETLTSEIEAKERELINLKISNEDLRTHIQQLNGVSMRDESFETEDMISANSFLSSLNTSETLSSVIDIQLQEARSENTLLKAQIIQLKDKLETTSKENDNATQLIFILQNKVKLLDDIQKEELRNAEKKILSLEETHKALQNERSLLQDQCKNLESLSVHNSELIVQAEQSKKELNLQLNSLNEQIEHLNKTLDAETVKSSNLEKVIHHQKKITDDHAKIENENMVLKQKVHDLEILEQKYKKEWDLELNSLNEQIEHLNKTLDAETVKSSNLEQVIHDQKKIIDDHAKAENENMVLKHKVHDLEILEQKCKKEWDLELNSLNEQIEHLNKTLNAETVKSSNLEQVIHDQKKIIDDQAKIENENMILKQKVHDLEILEQKCKKEWDLELSSLHEQIEHLNKTLDAETVKSSNLEKVIHDQKKIIDDKAKIENENMILKQKVHDLEILEQKYKKEWDLELNSLNEQIEHLNKTLNAEIVKSSNLEQVIHDQKKIIDDHAKAENENKVLKQKIHNLEILEQKRKNYIQNVIKEKTNLQELLSKVIISLGNLNDSFISLKQKWNQALNNFTNLYISNNLKCQDVEQLQIKKITIKKMLDKYDINHIQITKSIVDILWKRFYCAEQQLVNTYIKCSYDENESSFAEFYIEDNHIKEKEIIEEELENITMICNNVITSEAEIETFMHLISSHEKNCLTEQIKKEDNEQKLQLQIDQLTKEKKEIKNKLDLMRVRNAKLERTLEELRAEKKKIQEETKLTSQLTDLDDLKKEVAQLKKGNLLLQEEIDKLNKESTEDVKKEISEAQLKEIHSKYELKLENMKQQMKVAYNEQVSKLNKEQEKAIQEKVEQFQLRLEQLCQKHKEEIAKYKTHVNELNSQFWNVGERLLTAQQEKQEALLKLNELKVKLQNEAEQNPRRLSMHHKTIKTEKPENPFENSVQENSQIFSKELQEENTYEKQHCARNMHAMVNAFNAEDEEGEVFDNIYLADMKDGHCFPTVDLDRLSTLRMRNSLCKPHLKSSYPAETQFQPLYFSEEEIKAGEIKSPNSRILKERNADRRATATPRRSKGIFTLRRQDENVAGTPRTRRLSNIFRKTRTTFS
ncbi:hypothetical protein KPH14_001759 [Odynerus spinipes]|uniref:Uncharacterized protein n=1 Tax=Odynerus spinipes TaxID=1348599 RepID=A0AAD9RZN8_9HYME|nr:hypothetical protein KPH14_001759 [Odynerus spinipes]